MRLLVCGGAGFIGSNFVRRRLAATDDSIVVVDDAAIVRLANDGARPRISWVVPSSTATVST